MSTLHRIARACAISAGALVLAGLAPAASRAQDAPAPAAPSSARRLTLADALAMARARQPVLRRARAQTEASRARANLAEAPLYPQVEASASYQRTTANFTPRPGSSSSLSAGADPSFELYDYFDFGLTARQLVYDFGHTWHRADALDAEEQARVHDERAALQQIEERVRVSFFEVRAAHALLDVAREALANYELHLQQIEGFVRAGTRADIDLAQARTERANARVAVIQAENGYIAGKARLNNAIGIEASTDFEVSDESLAPIDGEDDALDGLLQRAIAERPELAALERLVRAQELTRSAERGGHGPSLSLFTGVSEAGVELDDMTWNWNAGVSVVWPLFQGGAVSARVDEASASLVALRAELQAARQAVRLEVEQARLSVRAAKAVITGSEEAIASAREQMRLAEGRYQAGVGSGLELGDAQLALRNASAQRVRAEYDLATARAGMLRALGR